MTHPILNERSPLLARHPQRSTRWLPGWTRWTAAAVLALMALSGAPVFAGKGGGRPDGGGDAPQYMAPFVEYRVTWVDLPAEMGTAPTLRDVNRDGFAVGWFEDPVGLEQGLLAHSDGSIWDLNDVFAGALLEFPGYRFSFALQINAAGQMAGLLLPSDGRWDPEAPDVLIVRADLYDVSLSLILVEHVIESGVSGIYDMNEAGDMLVGFGSDPGYGLCHAPYSAGPELLEKPLGADRIVVGNLNGAGQVSLAAHFTELVSINRKKTEESTVSYTYLREPDGTLRNLGYGGYPWWPARLSEAGTLYQSADGQPQQNPVHDRIHQWNEASGWEPVTPAEGKIRAGVSKEPGGEAEVLIEVLDGNERAIYREGYGTYPIEITVGLNGSRDLERWVPHPYSELLHGISRRELTTQAGYICGKQSGSVFILTPMPVAP